MVKKKTALSKVKILNKEQRWSVWRWGGKSAHVFLQKDTTTKRQQPVLGYFQPLPNLHVCPEHEISSGQIDHQKNHGGKIEKH